MGSYMASRLEASSAYPTRIARAAVIAAALWTPFVANAQSERSSFASITPYWQGSADIDDGGDFDAKGVALRAGMRTRLSDGVHGGVSLNYDGIDFDFSGRGAVGGAPWGNVQRIGLSLPFTFQGAGDWTYGVVPSVEWSRENGADSGDSQVYGAIVSATRSFAADKRLGFGLGAYSHIEENRVIPLIIVDWRLNERWRLVNPLPAGPVGPAGLELDYRFDNGWNLGVGATVRSLRFRLREDGPVRDGVGEETGVPVFLRASTQFGNDSSLHLYAGAIVAGKLRVEDSKGRKVYEESFDPTPILGATFSTRF